METASGSGFPAGRTVRRLRVMLADESCAVRERFRKGFETCSVAEIVAEAGTDQHTLDLLFQSHPEVVIVSTSLPAKGGFEVLRRIKRAVPRCEVILTSPCPNQFVRDTAHLLGAAGVCSADDGCSQLLSLLHDLWLSRIGRAFERSGGDETERSPEPPGGK